MSEGGVVWFVWPLIGNFPLKHVTPSLLNSPIISVILMACGSFVILLCNIHSLIMNFIKVFIRISRKGKVFKSLAGDCIQTLYFGLIVYNANARITSS